MRLFLAITLSEEVKDSLISTQEEINKDLVNLKLVDKDQIHLTLKFLGEIKEETLPKLKETLNQVTLQPFSFKLDQIGVFPNENYIKVIWVGIDPKEQTIELENKIGSTLKPFNFKKDFKFHPHITLARVKPIKEKQRFIENIRSIKIEKKRVEVDSFKLIKSTLTKTRPLYEEIASFPN